MVQITSYFVASLALLSGFVEALPRPDSSTNEPGVRAPNGTPITDTSMPQSTDMSSSDDSSYGSSGWDSSSGSNYGSSSSSYGSGSNYGSSSSSYGSGSNYGSGSSSSSDSSSDSGYGSSSNYGSGSSYGSDSSDDSSWTTTALATSTSTAWSSYSTPSYGSGSSSWSSSGYNDCVSQCMASYGGPPSTYTPPTTTSSSDSDSSSSSGSSSGSGATHTVIVAPTQGVLRYVPFAVNASVGDTILFMWGANNHTVTKSSELTPCNKTSDNPFSTGEQNQGFTFTQVVNDTNPTFFYCGTPTHCQKGMFGIINPPNADTPTSVSNMMADIAANSSDVAGYAAYTAKQTTGSDVAATWGSNIDLATLPDWSHELVAENVLYTRNLLAMNPDIISSDGSVNLSGAGSNPLMIPMDLAAALSSAAPASTATAAAAGTSPVAAAASTPSAASPPSGTAAAQNSGAFGISSSKVVVGLVATLATFLMM